MKTCQALNSCRSKLVSVVNCVAVFAAAQQRFCPAMIVLKNVRSGQRANGEQKCAKGQPTQTINKYPTGSSFAIKAASLRTLTFAHCPQ